MQNIEPETVYGENSDRATVKISEFHLLLVVEVATPYHQIYQILTTFFPRKHPGSDILRIPNCVTAVLLVRSQTADLTKESLVKLFRTSLHVEALKHQL